MPTRTHSSPPSLTPAAFHILLALATTERHGYGIMKQASLDSNEHIKLGPGTLYGTIKQLIAASAIEESGDRPDPELDDQRRRYYRITPYGQGLLGAELERLGQILDRARNLGLYHSLKYTV